MTKDENNSTEIVEVLPASNAIMALNSSEIDIQIATARRFPRSIKKFKDSARSLATLTEETAGSMFYKLPRGKDQNGRPKFIEGPSVRLAEIVATTWGNLRVESDIVEIGDTHVTAMGSAMDLESNTAARIRVKRKITDKNGRRYNDDMIGVTCNAACAIAYREALFKIVPRAMFLDIYEEAKKVSVGNANTLVDRRARAIDWFTKQGVLLSSILVKLGKTAIDDVELEDLEVLQGLRSAIKDGDLSFQAAFAEDETAPVNTDRAAAILAQVEAARVKAGAKTVTPMEAIPSGDLPPKQ